MIQEKAIVTRVENGHVWLKAKQAGACGDCVHQAACSTALVAKLMPKRELEISCDQPFEVGEEIHIALDDAQFLAGSFMLYLLPLLVMLAGVITADALLPESDAEIWLMPISLFFLFVGFRLAKSLLAKRTIRPKVGQQC